MDHLSVWIAHVLATLVLMGALTSLFMAQSVSARPRQRLRIAQAALHRMEELPHLDGDDADWALSFSRAHRGIDEQARALTEDAAALEELTGLDSLAAQLAALPHSPAADRTLEAISTAPDLQTVRHAVQMHREPHGETLRFWRSPVGTRLLAGLLNSLGAKIAIGGALGLVLGVLIAVIDPDLTHASLIETSSQVSFIVGAVFGGAAFFVSLFRCFPRRSHHHWLFGLAVRWPVTVAVLSPLLVATIVVALRALLAG